MNTFVRYLFHSAPIEGSDSNTLDANGMSVFKRVDEIGRIAGSGDAHHHVTRLAKYAQLPHKNVLVAEVVGDGGDDCLVISQADGAKRLFVGLGADRQVVGEVTSRRSTTAIANEEDGCSPFAGVEKRSDEAPDLIDVDALHHFGQVIDVGASEDDGVTGKGSIDVIHAVVHI